MCKVAVFPSRTPYPQEFQKLLEICARKSRPIAVFKETLTKGKKRSIEAFNYWFFGEGFAAKFVVPFEREEEAEAFLSDIATIIEVDCVQ